MTKIFSFNEENQKKALEILKRYPSERKTSALLPLLFLAQEQGKGWLCPSALQFVASFLNLPLLRVQEVAHFYSLYNLEPVGEKVIQVCTTTPCALRGGEEVLSACEKHLNIQVNQTTADGLFTLKEVECIGACVNAPVMQINEKYYEDLTPQTVQEILKKIKQGEEPKEGSQNGRQGSAPFTLISKIA